MKAKRTKAFPIFKMTEADECPVCESVLISFDGKRVICPSCGGRMIEDLRLALSVARLSRTVWKDNSAFDKIVKRLIYGKFGVDDKKKPQ